MNLSIFVFMYLTSEEKSQSSAGCCYAVLSGYQHQRLKEDQRANLDNEIITNINDFKRIGIEPITNNDKAVDKAKYGPALKNIFCV